MIRRAGQVLAAFVAVQMVFFLGLVLALQVPEDPIVRHLADAVEAGIYGPNYAPDRMGSMSDTFTECVVVGTGLGSSEAAATSPWHEAAWMPRLSSCDEGAQQILDLHAGQEVEAATYAKYWAGYVVLTRPVLATLGLDGMRLLAGLLLLTSGAVAALTVRRHLGTAVAVALLGPLVAGTNLLSTPSTSFSQAIAVSVIFCTLAATVAAGSRSLRAGLIATASMAALFCYVDLLTTPAIPWALAAFAVGATTYRRTFELIPTAMAFAAAALAWPVAFAATWVARWTIAAIFLGPGPMYRQIRSNVEYRTSGAYTGVEHELGAAIGRNIGSWWSTIPTAPLVLAACALALIVALIQVGLARTGTPAARWCVVLGLASAALIPAVWYEVLSNHSQIHAFFTNRGVPAALGVVVAAAWLVATQPRRHQHGQSVAASSASTSEQ